MSTTRTIDRTTGVVQRAILKGKQIRFTYTDEAGNKTRRTVTPVEVKHTRKSEVGSLVVAEEGENVRTFRTDRMSLTGII